MNPVEILITAGGTSEPIDDVRSVTNFSAGRLGHALAGSYNSFFDVELLSPKSTVDRFGEIEGVRHTHFRTTQDMKNHIDTKTSATLILHAAAVSDFAPDKMDGKIDSSGVDELTFTMRRVPKLLSGMREQFGQRATIVGFKLMSQVDLTSLIDTALAQIEDNDTDYCIANRLEDIGEGERTVYVVSRSKQVTELTGDTQAVAHKIKSSLTFQKRS